MKFSELLEKEFDFVRVEHPLISKMDYMRMGFGSTGNGHARLNNVIVYLCALGETTLKEVLQNGKWYCQ